MNKNNENLLFEVGLKNGEVFQIEAESCSIIKILDVGTMYIFGKLEERVCCNYSMNDININNSNAIIDKNDVSYIIRID